MKTLHETCKKKAHDTLTGIYRAKETQEMILTSGKLIEKERIIVVITQELVMAE